MQQGPLVSVIVPTKNSAAVLAACLQSIKAQTYPALELIVVDNFSADSTKAIADQHADRVYQLGPERSAQRNYGVQEAKGDIVLIIDADMELDHLVVAQCVEQFAAHSDVVGLVIPEESFGTGFWAQCKKLERSFYVGVAWMEAARAFRTDAYTAAGGYDESMVSGEDWDLSQRIAATGQIGRIEAYIMHNEGHLVLSKTLRKKYYYAKQFASYMRKNKGGSNLSSQAGPLARYGLYFKHPAQLFHNPLTGLGMLFMKTSEFAVGAFGLIMAKIA